MISAELELNFSEMSCLERFVHFSFFDEHEKVLSPTYEFINERQIINSLKTKGYIATD